MKILKLPFDMKIICECGCEFEFDYEDVCIDTYNNVKVGGDVHNIHRTSVMCHICHRYHDLKEEKE